MEKLKTMLAKTRNLILLSVVLPGIYGCGGESITSLGSLFGGSGGILGIGGGGIGGGGVIELASIVNPEPATMLLVGSGIVALGYFRRKKH